MSEIAHDEVLTLSEAARFIKVSEKTLRELAKKGRCQVKRSGESGVF